jgi:hypothetical protein
MYVADAIVLVFVILPNALHLYATQLTPSDVVGILLIDFVISLVTTPAVMWLIGTIIRARYRKEVL